MWPSIIMTWKQTSKLTIRVSGQNGQSQNPHRYITFRKCLGSLNPDLYFIALSRLQRLHGQLAVLTQPLGTVRCDHTPSILFTPLPIQSPMFWLTKLSKTQYSTALVHNLISLEMQNTITEMCWRFETKTKWPSFWRGHFQMIFLQS